MKAFTFFVFIRIFVIGYELCLLSQLKSFNSKTRTIENGQLGNKVYQESFCMEFFVDDSCWLRFGLWNFKLA